MLNSGVAPGHGNGETWILVLARLIAVPPITEAGIADRLRGQAHVVVEELSPLHQHVGAVFIHGHMVSRHQEGGDQARTWKMVAIVHSRGIPTCIDIERAVIFECYISSLNSYINETIPLFCLLSFPV